MRSPSTKLTVPLMRSAGLPERGVSVKNATGRPGSNSWSGSDSEEVRVTSTTRRLSEL